MPPRKTNRNSYTNRGYNSYGYYGTTSRSTTTRGTAGRGTTATFATSSPKFNQAKQECTWRMGSYRNVWSQFGAGSKTQFSPTNANKWTRYVNQGTLVYKFNTNQFSKFFGTQWNKWSNASPTLAKQYLRRKYGTGIKDVTRGNNCWLVAATKNVTGTLFRNYNWQ